MHRSQLRRGVLSRASGRPRGHVYKAMEFGRVILTLRQPLELILAVHSHNCVFTVYILFTTVCLLYTVYLQKFCTRKLNSWSLG